MTLYTASIQRKRNEKDGFRVSVMRFNRNYYDFDMLMIGLAPSKDLLLSYKKGKIKWKEYEERYKNEVLKKNNELVELVADMAEDRDVTLLCWEKSPQKCHRRLIVEECKKYNPDLKVVLR